MNLGPEMNSSTRNLVSSTWSGWADASAQFTHNPGICCFYYYDLQAVCLYNHNHERFMSLDICSMSMHFDIPGIM